MRRPWDAIVKRLSLRQSPDRDRAEPPSQPYGGSRRTIFSSEPRVCAISDIGRVRDHNEDAFHVSPGCDWFVVADGMGGHEAGEVAAALAVQAIVEQLTPGRLLAAGTQGDTGSLLLDAVAMAHARVREANRNQKGDNDMGCTLAVCCLADGLVTSHVGDVRCYVVRRGSLDQITKDHSVVGVLVAAGQLTDEQARVHENKNEVLQAIGMAAGVRPDVTCAEVAPGDRILLCSDGLWEALSHDEIQSIVTSDGTVRQLATQLVDRANGAGGHDNVTVILFEVASVVRHSTAVFPLAESNAVAQRD